MRDDGPGRKAGETERRGFLKLIGIGAAAGSGGLAAGVVSAPAEAAVPPVVRAYRETAHVKKVYELARF
jgi:hypothetical protein